MSADGTTPREAAPRCTSCGQLSPCDHVRAVAEEADTPDHVDQGSVAARFDASAAREGAACVRWDENRALTLLHDDPTDLFDLLDAAVEVLAHPDEPGYRDALAVRVAEIVPEALP